MNRLAPIAVYDAADGLDSLCEPLLDREVVGCTHVERFECCLVGVMESSADTDDMLSTNDAVANQADW